MIDDLLSTADLLEVTGYRSAGALRRSLDRQGVPYFLGKDGPWTTKTLLNGAKHEQQAPARYSPEML